MYLCLLDQDGVIADFIGGACRTHGLTENPYKAGETYFDLATREESEVHDVFGLEANTFWDPMNYEWWSALPKTPDCDELLAVLKEFFGPKNIALCSAPSLNPGCMPGKVEWLKVHAPFLYRQFCFAPNKKFFAGPQRLLIDDREKNTLEFEEAGGKAFLYPRVWNRRHAEEPDAVKLLTEFLHRECND
jgi:hypothetical protein